MDIKTESELTPEQKKLKKDMAKQGIDIAFSKRPFVPNLKYMNYLSCKDAQEAS